MFKPLHKTQLLLEATPPSLGTLQVVQRRPCQQSVKCSTYSALAALLLGFCASCVCEHTHLCAFSQKAGPESPQPVWEPPEARDLLLPLDPHPAPDLRTRLYLEKALRTSACLTNRWPQGRGHLKPLSSPPPCPTSLSLVCRRTCLGLSCSRCSRIVESPIRPVCLLASK